MGRRAEVGWQESREELKHRCPKEGHPQRRIRLQALWHLRQGKSIEDVVEITGASYRNVQQWLQWYREGGLAEVLRRVVGHHAKGKQPYLSPLEQRALVAKVQLGEFRTIWALVEWVQGRWGVSYTYQGMYSLLKGHGLGLKVPRPHSEKAGTQQQATWKGGVVNALGQGGATKAARLWHCDEMRCGLWGQVRRCWGLRG
jgi:transposase